MSRLALALLLCLPAALRAQDNRLAGDWAGRIELPGMELRVEIRFTQGAEGLQGTISIPQQNARNLPLVIHRAAGDSATFSITGVPGEPTFAGALNAAGDSLSGDFRQGGATYPFRLGRAAAPAAAAGEALADVDSLVASALERLQVPGVAVGVVYRDSIILSRGFGWRDVANRLPVTPQTLFAIGSATKAFNTFALGVLADSGRFDWDRPVREYLPGLVLWDDVTTLQLTARDMVTHRTGLPRHDLAWYNNAALTMDSMFRTLRHFEPNRQLREQWQYNNMMFVLAGYLLARLEGTSWEQAIARRVFEPLGMRHSNISVQASQQAPDHALPYRFEGDSIVRTAFRDITNVGPAGSINSSIEDMLQWARVHVSEGRLGERSIIGAGTLREIHTPQMIIPGLPTDSMVSPASYALGWFTNTYRGRYRVFHGGNIDGFSALVTLFPREQLGIVVLTNMNGTILTNVLTNTLADRVLDLPRRDWIGEAATQRAAGLAAQRNAAERRAEERVRNTRPAFPLAAYAGEYEHPGYGVLRVAQARDRLQVTYNGITAPFEHWHYEVFNGLKAEDPTMENVKLQFASDVRGRVSSVAVVMESSVPPIRFARRPDAELRDPARLALLAGAYQLESGTPVHVRLQGDRLVAELPGQPRLRLNPDRDGEFALDGLEGYAIRFTRDASGRATELRILQPNGVFLAKRTD